MGKSGACARRSWAGTTSKTRSPRPRHLVRRANLGALGKSLWLLAILLLPVLGTVLYYVFRPLQVPRSRRPTERSSSALESRDTMLVDMHGRGVITSDEYEADRSPRGRSV